MEYWNGGPKSRNNLVQYNSLYAYRVDAPKPVFGDQLITNSPDISFGS